LIIDCRDYVSAAQTDLFKKAFISDFAYPDALWLIASFIRLEGYLLH